MSVASSDFDAYYVLLGIPPKDQPPNYYRLLGLEQFESDDEIISMAAERQMGYLMPHESGDHVDEVARLASEVSRARLCLLDPSKKKDYDESLAAEIEAILESQAEQQVRADEQPLDDLEIVDAQTTESTAPESTLPPPRPTKSDTARSPSTQPRNPSTQTNPTRPTFSKAAPITAQLAPQTPALHAKPHVATSAQPEKENADFAEEPWIKRNLWVVIAGGAAALLLFFAVLAVIVIVTATKEADDELVELTSKPVEEDSLDVAETPTLPADEKTTTPQAELSDDNILTGTLTKPEDSDPVSPEVPESVKVLRVEPQMPLAGDTVGVWLPTDVPLGVMLEYRDQSSTSWRRVTRRRVSFGSRRAIGAASATRPSELPTTPTFTIYDAKTGILRIDVRATNTAGNSSEISTVEVEVAENPWERWREAARISHNQGIEQIDFFAGGKQVVVMSKQNSSSYSRVQLDRVTQFTTWDTSDFSLVNDLSTLDTVGGKLRADGSLVIIRQIADPGSVPTASEPNLLLGRFGRTVRPIAPQNQTYSIEAEVEGRQILLAEHSGQVSRVAFSPDGRFVAIGFEKHAAVWNLESQSAASLPDDLDTGADGESEAEVAEEAIELDDDPLGNSNSYDSASPASRPLFKFSWNTDAPLRFGPAGNLVARGGSNVEIWSVGKRGRLSTLATPASCLAFSQDGKRLVTSWNGEIKIWDVTTGGLKSTIGCQLANRRSRSIRLARATFGTDYIGSKVSQLCFHPQGNELAVVVDNRTAIFRIADGRRMHDFGYFSGVTCLTFSPDGSTLATGGADRTVRLLRASDTSTTKSVRADPPLNAQYLRADKRIAKRQFGRALDALQLSRYVPGNESFANMLSSQYCRPVYTSFDNISKLSLAPEVRERFDLIVSELKKEHSKLAIEAMRNATMANDKELANFNVYARFPDELLPSDFVETQRKLHIDREKQALRYWERAKALMNRSKPNKSAARVCLLKIVAMEDYLPKSAKQARDKMRELGLNE